MSLLTILTLVSAAAFLYYGISFFTDPAMQTEFERYNLKRFKNLTGYLQLLGAAGLLVGLKVPLILSVASAGLTVLMLMGFIVRLKIKDGFLLSAPSFFFMLLNLYIFIESVSIA